MAPSGWPLSYNSTTATQGGLTYGFVPSPNGRGTFDILESCVVTIILCSWSVLFLNVPDETEGYLQRFRTQAWWMLFTIFFPEMLTGIAAEQWRSASQSVEDFAKLEKQWANAPSATLSPKELSAIKHSLERFQASPWTMRHAFFADMGGILLNCPDLPAFPVDSHQLVYLVENGHLEYPDIQSRTIWDKNKANTCARALTLIQIVWFLVQSIGRWAQHLKLSTLDLSTIAFIFCTTNTFFFFRHKPRDVETALVLQCETSLAQIQEKAGDRSRKPYRQTPLDFVKPSTNRNSLIAPFWFAIRICFDWRKEQDLPVRTFGNSKTTPPRGINVVDMVYGTIFVVAYFGIHLVGWDFVFPSRTEQILWRASTLMLLSLAVFYFFLVATGIVLASYIARSIFKNNEATTPLEVASLLPRWLAVIIHLPFIAVYCLARSYIIVEGFVNLRALPVTVFASVDWLNYVPHI